MTQYPKPPYPEQQQEPPGYTKAMKPRPDHGEQSYKGSGRLKGKRAVITGGDSGIGRAVAIAYAREGADILISYLEEEEDAKDTAKLVEEAGRKAILVAGDVQDPKHCRAIIDKAVSDLGGIDILVNNAAHQATFKKIEDISDEEWDLTFRVNIHAMFYLTKAAVPHMKRRQRHYQHGIDQLRRAQSYAARLRHDQGSDPQFHGWPCTAARRQGHPSQRRCSGPDLDAADSLDHAGRACGKVR